MSNSLEYISSILTVLYAIGGFLLSLWWIWIPWILFLFVRDFWIKHRRIKFVQGLEWVILEIVPPREIVKTPLAIEQFFAGLHGTISFPNWWDRNVKGIVPDYFSLEIISQAGEIHFLIRTLKKFRNIIESNIYAQYPDSEIFQVNDYTDSVPVDIPNEKYDLWGTELIMVKEDAYPIRTYPAFERDIVVEEKRVDPIASLLEIMGNIEQGEQVWIQYLIRPVPDHWEDEGEKIRDELISRVKEKKQGAFKKEVIGWKDAGKGVAHQLVTGDPLEGGSAENSSEDKRWKSLIDPPTKVEKDIVTAIEEKAAKVSFEVILRYLYIASADIFRASSMKRAIDGCYRQFGSHNLNSFKRNGKISPGIDYRIQLKKPRDIYRKKRVFNDYKKRAFVNHSRVFNWLRPYVFERLPILNWFHIRSKPFVFNIEELATVYHFPTMMVKAPLVPKVEAKKSEPPRGLPVQ